MPRYDYRCDAGHKYEVQQPFGSPTEHPCERCGKPAHRVLVAPPLVFKGGGFYKTSGRSDSGSSSSDSPKGVRSKTPPKQAETPSEPSSSTSTASAAADE